MAELRRVGGGLESHRRPGGRRALLPAEAELCNALGLTESDYWYFVELTEAYNGQRDEAYALVPDVRNDPVSIVLAVIGIALQAVGYLLAPKPSAPKTPPQLKTADLQGRSRFTPQTSFDSVQSLATLGDVIPLVFTRKGIRVTGQLLWSQLLSLGNGQQLKAMVLFSLGALEAKPEFAGYAIGDTLLENYTHAKLALFFTSNGGRLTSAHRYSEGTLPISSSDPFDIYWDLDDRHRPFFSGTRNPGTQAQFGAYQPVPNGMRWLPAYELILKPNDAPDSIRADIEVKRSKVYSGLFAYRCSVTSKSSTTVVYRIDDELNDGKGYQPWGTQDFASAQESAKIDADEALQVGELYVVGGRPAICTRRSERPWEEGRANEYFFEWTEGEGYVDVCGPKDKFYPYEKTTILRCAIATVSNNRSCHVTEIGIKSTVWKQVSGFANVNSMPSEALIDKYEAKGGSITLGNVSKYITRLSFFKLEARVLGSNANWVNISNDTLFCVKGQTPQPQYNYIRITQSFGQHEYRLVPVAGNVVYRNYLNKDVYLLRPGKRLSYVDGKYSVTFSGIRYPLSAATTSNTEWIKGSPPAGPQGQVIDISSTDNGKSPYKGWERESDKYSLSTTEPYHVRTSYWENKDYFYWGEYIGRTDKDEHLVDGDYRYRKGSFQLTGRSEIIRDTRKDSPISYSADVNASGGSGTGLVFHLIKRDNGAISWTLVSGGRGYKNGESVTVPTTGIQVTLKTNDFDFIKNNLNPYDMLSDYRLYEAENGSHFDGPEHEIAYVNEQLEQTPPKYPGLAIGGLCINSSREWTSFNELSAYITKGVVVERLTTSGRSASNLLPEIAYALLTDDQIGAGKLIGASQVDRDRMKLAAQFCEANGFTWDGVIDSRQNLREWIFEHAGYCLLDFTILGGQFSLVPSVPYGTNFKINPDKAPDIKALFTDGNIKDLQVSFLSPEERQLFRATVLWRREKRNGFPETQVVTVRFANSEGGSAADPEETFDMSGFCTTQSHALLFAKYALKVRKEVDHGLKFTTTPQAAMNLMPGDYFRLVSKATHTSRFHNGLIGSDGAIQSANSNNLDQAQILYWVPGTTELKKATLTVSDDRTKQEALYGTVFTVLNEITEQRIYKVESLSYAEDGLVEVAGSYAPVTDQGKLAVLDWTDESFVIETG